MPALSLATDAFVLLKRPPADAFQSFTAFSAEHGTLTILQRLAKKSAATASPLDLFDEASLLLESSNQGRTWFVKETRLLARPSGIGRSYEALRFASEFAALIARNNVHEDSRAAVATLLRTAFAAFATGLHPEVVHFKSVFCFARDEGYPVKQEWLSTLPSALRTEAQRLLRTPLANLEKPGQLADVNVAPDAKTKILTRRLGEYLRGHTDILLD